VNSKQDGKKRLQKKAGLLSVPMKTALLECKEHAYHYRESENH
jgi:hypothetical protein